MARRNDESAQNQDEYNHAFDTPSAGRGALKKKSSAESAAGREGRREAEAGSVHGAAAGEGVSGALRCAPLCRCDESVTVCLGEYKGAKKLPFRFRDGNSNRSGNEHLQTTRLHSREQSEPPGLDERGWTSGAAHRAECRETTILRHTKAELSAIRETLLECHYYTFPSLKCQ